ncbi:carbonic anhydrase [Terrimonas sp. NA20]|uniref:Carbonic anhydrase n=1 Tax=Terrimonas ginsenosidimutans TaxID=2908004 RepID=A0ABS9KNJ4_9BACT|nr:carbonic anhydrase family protein [Terrimonas ginsenosidimutans]MCG2613898.1 carbonic anhydrase [Terrimonas ginsenosidimutans]
MRTHTKEFQQNLTPSDAFEVLKEGNKRFINNLKLNRDLLQQMDETANGQYPWAVILSCMDSRTSVEHIFDQGIGDIFSIRIAGNVVNDDIVGSMEYACAVAGSKLVVVLGHTKCGAIKGACDHVQLGNLTGLLEKVNPAIEKTSAASKETTKENYAEIVAQANVIESMNEVLEKSTILRDLYEEGKIGIVGGIYNVENGKVSFTRVMFAESEAVVEESATTV